MHVNEIKKVALKKENEFTDTDKFIKTTAIIIAAFSSRHSWETHKCMETAFAQLNANAIREEYIAAMNEKWKQVSFFDISEIASIHLQDKVFYRWLFLFVDSHKHREYKEAWLFLKGKMVNYSDEPMGILQEKQLPEPAVKFTAVQRLRVKGKQKHLTRPRKA